MDKIEKIKLFANELNDINSEKLRLFAEELIANADDYFFQIAASTTGKYHPQFDLGDGGLVRHTRCVEFFAKCEAESRMFTEHETDLLIVSALAHDIKKLGNNGSKYTVGDHPTVAAEYVRDMAVNNPNLINDDDMNIIMGCVRSHMGQWGTKDKQPLPKTDLEKALQAADYIASRKEILDFNFRPVDVVEKPVATENSAPQENVDLGNYIVLFGKNKNKTLNEIKADGTDYLEWVAKQEDFFNKEAQTIIRKFLAQGKEPKVESTITSNSGNNFDELPF